MKKLAGWVKQHLIEIVIAGGVGFVLIVAPTIYANLSTKSQRYNLDNQNIPTKDVAVVLGAGIYADGTPTPYLRLRIETAVALYANAKVKKILMSGDNSSANYDEPSAMKRYAVSLDVPESDIVLDYAGRNTYDSCYRTKHIFNINSAIVVTQGYHLPRAIMTCKGLGIDTIGVAAKREGRDFTVSYIAREYVSTFKSAVQLTFKPKPTVLGSPEEPIVN